MLYAGIDLCKAIVWFLQSQFHETVPGVLVIGEILPDEPEDLLWSLKDRNQLIHVDFQAGFVVLICLLPFQYKGRPGFLVHLCQVYRIALSLMFSGMMTCPRWPYSSCRISTIRWVSGWKVFEYHFFGTRFIPRNFPESLRIPLDMG